MTSSLTPKTPEQPIGRAALRRSFTVPPKFSTTSAKQPEIGAADGIETLYIHPSARVVSFSTSQSSSRPSSSSGRASLGSDSSGAGILPWASATERTLAAGPLELYRVPGSVSFLHSGTLLHAILPRSQCWCVDGISKFVFRVLPETYYRIELPGVTEEDLKLVEELKVTFKKVLFYERTACPFKRGFEVELPPDQEKPRRRVSMGPTGPAKRWRLNRVWRPEGSLEEDAEESRSFRSDSSDEELNTMGKEASINMAAANPSTSLRPGNFSGSRSITAPPQLTLHNSPPSKVLPIFGLNSITHKESGMATANKVLVATDVAKMPPTPESMPETDENPYEQVSDQKGEKTPDVRTILIDEATEEPISTSADTDNQKDRVVPPMKGVIKPDAASAMSTPSLASDSEAHSWGEMQTPPEVLRRRRPRKAPSQRSRSPSLTNLYRTTSRESQQALTDGLVRKTCFMFLGPPAHLVSLMLRIAAKIASGAVNMTIQSPPGSHRRVPGSWDLSDDEDDWDVDDCGFSLSGKADLVPTKAALGTAWELD